MIVIIIIFHRSFADQDATRRLWISTAGFLTNHINQTHEVNQGDSIDHDFSATLEVLLFPIMALFSVDLPVALMNDITTLWSNLFESFVRESSLLSAIKDNQAIEDLCSTIHFLIKSEEINIKVSFEDAFKSLF